MRKVTARAPSNVALVKYWGKRDATLNLPATGSISVNLGGLETTTTVTVGPEVREDACRLDGHEDPATTARVLPFLEMVRSRYGVVGACAVDTRNGFPTGAGLASSASGFAALAVALDRAFDLGLPPSALSALARRGSGSAARSVVDGWAEMHPGTAGDGEDAYATPLGGPDLIPVEIVVAVTTTRRKDVGSTEGMRASERTSPFHEAWLASTREDLAAMRAALAAGDLERVGRVAERSCLRMHADMMATEPALLYWNGTTIEVVHAVRAMRTGGLPAWFTIDAGPQVKVLTAAGRGDEVAARLGEVPGVERVLRARPARGARVVEDLR